MMALRTTLKLPYNLVTHAIGSYYNVVMDAQTLLEICQFDFRQIKTNNGVKEFLGIQRRLSDDRVKDIRKYIHTVDACFPTSIVISIDENCAKSADKGILIIEPYQDPADPALVIPFTGIATIIDGQHRLKAFEGTNINWDLSVNIFVGISEGTQATIFSKVNLAQTKVNKSLVYDLFALDKGSSPEKTAHELVVLLNDMSESPFYQRIKRLGSATEGVFGETLSQATIVKGLLELLSKQPMVDRDIGARTGAFPERGQDDFERRIFYPFFRSKNDEKILAVLINYFSAVRERWPTAWESTGKGDMLLRTNGYNGLIRFLRDAYLHFTSKPTVVGKEQFTELFAKVGVDDAYFNNTNFPAGSSGAANLYRLLMDRTASINELCLMPISAAFL